MQLTQPNPALPSQNHPIWTLGYKHVSVAFAVVAAFYTLTHYNSKPSPVRAESRELYAARMVRTYVNITWTTEYMRKPLEQQIISGKSLIQALVAVTGKVA